MPKAHDICIPQLHVPPLRHLLPIDHRPIRALQINHIRPHLPLPIPKLRRLLDIPELDNGVLLRRTRVLHEIIHHGGFATEQPAGLCGERDRVDDLGAFEHVHAPGRGGGGFARFRGLVVFEYDCGPAAGLFDRVGLGCELACWGEVWFLLLGGRVLALCYGYFFAECIFLIWERALDALEWFWWWGWTAGSGFRSASVFVP